MGLLLVLLAQDAGARLEGVLKDESVHLRVDVRLDVARALAPAAAGADGAAALVTPELLRTLLTYLSSDGLGGRNAGSADEKRATEFIARQFAAAGLSPAGDKGTYLQSFTFGEEARTSFNALGLLEGSDPELKDQLVVIGAHHDHVGNTVEKNGGQIGGAAGDDGIWNGADDNGSGTTAVLALARAFGAAGLKPRRSILFMTFGAEEWGLLGSRHYVAHPIRPIDRHVAMINLDMIGRNPERPVEAYGLATSDVWPDLVRRACEKTKMSITPHDGVLIDPGGASDHQSFYARDIPTIFFFTFFHPDYHRVSDHPDKIDYPNQARVARTAAHVLWEVAQRDAPPGFKKVESPPRPAARRLGVNLVDIPATDLEDLGLPAEAGGVKIGEIAEKEGAAAKAGMQAGDIVVAFGGKALPREKPTDALRAALRELKEKSADLEYFRDGQRQKVKIEWK